MFTEPEIEELPVIPDESAPLEENEADLPSSEDEPMEIAFTQPSETQP